MGTPRFEEVPAGESRQINGPIFGVRVLASQMGAACLVDRVSVPLSSLLTIPAPHHRPFDTVILTGPILVQFAMEEADDLSAVASPLQGTVKSQVVTVPLATYLNGSTLFVFTRQPAERHLALFQLSGDRPYTKWRFEYGDGVWEWAVSPIASVPAALLHFNPSATQVASAGILGLTSYTGSGIVPLPAPDKITAIQNTTTFTGTMRLLVLTW